jgi:tetratricopeptide (TPR) repeat protein
MKKIAILSFLTFASIGCGDATQQATNTTVTVQSNTNVATQKSDTGQKSDNSMIVSSHSSDAAKSAPAQPTKTDSAASSSSSSPMSKAVDVTKMTADIENADKSFKQNQNDEKAKGKLAEAYFVRAFALTEAAQYRAALGDFRKGLKLDPNNADAKAMHDQIITIFQSIGREPPKEGEEAAPLPIK